MATRSSMTHNSASRLLIFEFISLVFEGHEHPVQRLSTLLLKRENSLINFSKRPLSFAFAFDISLLYCWNISSHKRENNKEEIY